MKTGRRLWNYALQYKKLLIWAVVLLIIAVGTELTGPFIGKKMIDDHILGIEKHGLKPLRTIRAPSGSGGMIMSGRTGSNRGRIKPERRTFIKSVRATILLTVPSVLTETVRWLTAG
ncbi:putative multidrug resistance ABC transporter ATP-binding/permease protein YheH [Bacillus velezensis]|nr:putative multidrug resistance ABC transporter ATP-binding/permease protein YheH [Bacillus velezensis]